MQAHHSTVHRSHDSPQRLRQHANEAVEQRAQQPAAIRLRLPFAAAPAAAAAPAPAQAHAQRSCRSTPARGLQAQHQQALRAPELKDIVQPCMPQSFSSLSHCTLFRLHTQQVFLV